jgi:predicted transcriptional regulator
MKTLDKILTYLQDSQWHSLDEIKNCIYLPSDTLFALLIFLKNQSFIDVNEDKMRITGLGLKFLHL